MLKKTMQQHLALVGLSQCFPREAPATPARALWAFRTLLPFRALQAVQATPATTVKALRAFGSLRPLEWDQ